MFSKYDLLHYVTEIIAGSSMLLAAYRAFFEKIFLVWIPKTDNKWSHTFWTLADKTAQTLELISVNSQSAQVKNAVDFVQSAKQVLPDEVVNKVVERTKEEALKK